MLELWNENVTIMSFQAHSARKVKTTKRKLPVSENIYGGMTEAEILEAHEKESLLTQQDRAVERTKEKKNSLESYIYEMRSKVHTCIHEM